MHPSDRHAGRCLAAFISLLLCLNGCRTPPVDPRHAELSLSDEDVDMARALAHYGTALLYEGELGRRSEDALEQFRDASDLDPASHRLYSRIAITSLFRDDPESAIKALRASCEANPDDLQPRIDLAKAYSMLDRKAEAVRTYEAAWRLEPGNPLIPIEIARVHFSDEKDDAALSVLRKGFQQAEDKAPLLAYCYTQGTTFIQSRQPKRSIGCFRLLAEKVPSDQSRFYHLLGELYESLDNDSEAVRNFELATRQEQPTAQSFVKLAFIQVNDNPEMAVATLQRGLARLPGNPVIRFALAYVFTREEQPLKAVAVFDRMIAEAEKKDAQRTFSPTFYLHYGLAAERAGLIDKATQIFETCLSLYPDAHEVLNTMAYMWAEKGLNLDRAEEAVTRALELEPDNAAYIDTLGWVYYQQGKYRDALVHLSRAAELLPDDPVICEHVARTHEALGETHEATAAWRRLLTIQPENALARERLEAAGVNPEASPDETPASD